MAPRPGMVYFPETGHNLGGRFLAYWQRNGDLAQFGFPLTDEVTQPLEGGATYQVQYFERARFEYHPENQAPYDVLLGQFGRRILGDNDLLGVTAGSGLGVLYVTNEEVQGRLGLPTAPAAATAPGATQAFEGGRMIWRGDTRRIYALCGGEQDGLAVYEVPDTWDAGQDPGGGPAPAPGRSSRSAVSASLAGPPRRARLPRLRADRRGDGLYPAGATIPRPLRSQPDGIGDDAGGPLHLRGVPHWLRQQRSCISAPHACLDDYDRYADPAR